MTDVPKALAALRKAGFEIEPVKGDGALRYKVLGGVDLSGDEMVAVAEAFALGASKYGAPNWSVADHLPGETMVDEIERMIADAKEQHDVTVSVIYSMGAISVSAMRQDRDRFFVAKHKAVEVDGIKKAVQSAVDEILAERAAW